MATLNGTQIDNTYSGLLKTSDNGALNGTYKVITDGVGNDSGIQLSTSAPGSFETILTSDAAYTNAIAVNPLGTSIVGTTQFQTGTVEFASGLTSVDFNGVPSVDFTGSTVTGLPNTTYDLAATQDGLNIEYTKYSCR